MEVLLTEILPSEVPVDNEFVVNVRTLERRFNERVDRGMSNIVDTLEDRIQNAILTAIDNIIARKIELAIRSLNASPGRDAASVATNSERGEHVRIHASFQTHLETTMYNKNQTEMMRLGITFQTR